MIEQGWLSPPAAPIRRAAIATRANTTVDGRTNRTIKEATGKRFHYDSYDQLPTNLADFMAA